MKNVTPFPRTPNSPPAQESEPSAASTGKLSFLSGDRLTYSQNIIADWQAQLRYLNGLAANSCQNHLDCLMRLIEHAQVAPWECRESHVIRFLESRTNPQTDAPLAPATVAAYCSAWRSFQAYMLDLERSNEILVRFKIRPQRFVTEENSIAVKRYKLGWRSKAWAMTPTQIDAVDEAFRSMIKQAYLGRSKSLHALQRDRVMFHVAIHLALRVGELVTLTLDDFRESHDRQMSHFGDLGVVTLTGKNSVTGTVPMRDPSVEALLRWYLLNCRQKILMGRRCGMSGTCTFEGKTYITARLVFPSERGGPASPDMFRRRLKAVASQAGIAGKLYPHILRHTGCTLMVPLYSPEIAQKYMRHKSLYTTLGYYHPSTLDAGNEVNAALELFADDEFDDVD
jgi:integrase